MMYLAFYKAPGNWLDRLIRSVERGPYSHVELVVGVTLPLAGSPQLFCSSSPRDGGVRRKLIPADPTVWDFVPLPEYRCAVNWFIYKAGEGYDWLGALRTQIKWLPQSSSRWFCVEAVATALGRKDLDGLGVNDFYLAMTRQTPTKATNG